MDRRNPLFGPPLLRPLQGGERRPNPDGSYSTEITMTAPDPSGQWMNFPSLWMGPNGPVELQGEDAAQKAAIDYEAFGYEFPRFKELSDAERVAEMRSQQGGVSLGALARALINGVKK